MRVYTIEIGGGKIYNNPLSTTRLYTSKKSRDKVLNGSWHKRHAEENGLELSPHTYELVEIVERLK